MASKLIPLLDRVLVERLVAPSKTIGGVLLPESSSKINSAKVVATGAGRRTKDGQTVPVIVKEGDKVLLPEYGGQEIKLGDKEFMLYRDEEILGILHD